MSAPSSLRRDASSRVYSTSGSLCREWRLVGSRRIQLRTTDYATDVSHPFGCTCLTYRTASLIKGPLRRWQEIRSDSANFRAREQSVTHRTFKDRQGRIWDVWQVHPSAAERRFSQRRVFDEDRTDNSERRSGSDRRLRERDARAPVAAEFAYGWLCFETVGEKRRLAPVPEGWDRADDEMIEQWCCVAKPAVRRKTGEMKGAQPKAAQ